MTVENRLVINQPTVQTAARKTTSNDYVETFDNRGDLYNAASLASPHAREIERQILIDSLAIESHHCVCDAPAGGGYLADGIRVHLHDTRQLVCVEPSQVFAQPISSDYQVLVCPISQIPIENEHFDRFGSLAGLHHLTNKNPFFEEATRVLKPGGRLAVGDVLADTSVARFLNGPVDHYTESGHRGIFVEADEFVDFFDQATLVPLSVKHHRFAWEFDSEVQLIDYCKSLFGMVKATQTQVANSLDQHFNIYKRNDKVCLPWSLVYGVAQKPSSC